MIIKIERFRFAFFGERFRDSQAEKTVAGSAERSLIDQAAGSIEISQQSLTRPSLLKGQTRANFLLSVLSPLVNMPNDDIVTGHANVIREQLDGAFKKNASAFCRTF